MGQGVLSCSGDILSGATREVLWLGIGSRVFGNSFLPKGLLCLQARQGQKEREADRQRQKEGEGDREREREIARDRHTDRQTDRKTNTQTGRQT